MNADTLLGQDAYNLMDRLYQQGQQTVCCVLLLTNQDAMSGDWRIVRMSSNGEFTIGAFETVAGKSTG